MTARDTTDTEQAAIRAVRKAFGIRFGVLLHCDDDAPDVLRLEVLPQPGMTSKERREEMRAMFRAGLEALDQAEMEEAMVETPVKIIGL